ncbi:MAG: type II toxin-antitoxin system RelE/ParE family toxin [Rickettsiales bacterium]
MANFLILPQAEQDLDEIWWYIAQDNPKNADRFLDSIQETCVVVSEYPNMGEARDELFKRLRSFPVGNYLVFYISQKDKLNIVRVLHGSRDLKHVFE